MAHGPLPIAHCAQHTHTHTIPIPIPMHTHAHPHPYLDSPFSTLFPFPPDITSFLQLPPCITHPISLVDLFAPLALIPGTALRPPFNCPPWLFSPGLPYFCALYFLDHPIHNHHHHPHPLSPQLGYLHSVTRRPDPAAFSDICTLQSPARCLRPPRRRVIFLPSQPGPNSGVPPVRMDLNRHM